MVEHQQALTDHWRNRIDSTQLVERVRRLRTFQKKGRLVEPASVTAGAMGSAPSSERWLRALSIAVGYAADNALLGATVGGNLPGGLIGQVLQGCEPDNDRSRTDPAQPTTISE